VRAKRVDYNEETKLIVPADATRYGNLIVAPFIGAPILLIIFIVFLARTSKKPANKNKNTK
jgi:sortase A